MPANAGFYVQQTDIEVSRLEPEIQEAAKARGLDYLQYNKGLWRKIHIELRYETIPRVIQEDFANVGWYLINEQVLRK